MARAMARPDLIPLRHTDLPALEEVAETRAAPAGTVLVPTGATVTEIFVVRDGRLQLAVRTKRGRHVVALIPPGGVCADLPMFCEQPMPFDAIAEVDSTVIALDREGLLALLRRSPSLSLRWTTSVAKRMDEMQRRLVAVLTKDLTAQVAALLLDEREQDPAGEVVVRHSHATMAQLLGARRQSVSRVLRELRKRGLVEGGYRQVVLIDPAGLAAITGDLRERSTCDPPATSSAHER